MGPLVAWIPAAATWLREAAGRVLRDPQTDALFRRQGDLIVRLSEELDARQRRHLEERAADEKMIDGLRKDIAELRRDMDIVRTQHDEERANAGQVIENQKEIIAGLRRQIESYEREARFHLGKVRELEAEIARIKRLLEAQELARRNGEQEPRTGV